MLDAMTANSDRQTLPPLPSDGIERVLLVVAHPDDPEYGLSAAVSSWTRRGIAVSYLLMTSGEAGMQSPPEEVGPLRAGEQRAACDEVGVDDLVILDFPDGVLEYGLDLRRAIARRVREVRPDVVVTTTWDVETTWGLNQADHRAVGLACLDATRDADNTWVFPELARDVDLPKWGPRWLLVSGAEPTHAIEVDQVDVDAAVRSLEAHREYLAQLPNHPAPNQMIPDLLAEGGKAAGVEHAVVVRALELRPE